MKARVNNLITQYENERDRIKAEGAITPANQHRLDTIKEVIRALTSLRR